MNEMKKIINGTTYNTETAKKIASRECRYYQSTDEYFVERIYKTKKGRYFLHGDGGMMTKYAKYYDDGSIGGGEEIYPLSEKEAKKLIRKKFSAEEYAAEWPSEN